MAMFEVPFGRSEGRNEFRYRADEKHCVVAPKRLEQVRHRLQQHPYNFLLNRSAYPVSSIYP